MVDPGDRGWEAPGLKASDELRLNFAGLHGSCGLLAEFVLLKCGRGYGHFM